MRAYKLARGLAVHPRFDDLDLISRSQVCQNHNLQIVLDSCLLLLNCAWLLHILKKIEHSMLRVPDVDLGDTSNTILVLEFESSERLLFLFIKRINLNFHYQLADATGAPKTDP